MTIFLNYLIFPGLLFSILAGGFGWWLERKLSARFQYRIGPPWYQTYLDLAKLFIKETLIPEGASKYLFIFSPLISFSSALIFTFIVTNNYFFNKSFFADILVMLYLLIIPSLFIILGALASRNPLALVGAARETKLMLAYEFIFIVSLVIILIKAGGRLTMAEITFSQITSAPFIKSFSGIIAFILSIFYLQAKLGIGPYDAPEAEQEIMGGTMIEYSGPLLGFYRLTKVLLYFSLPVFIIALFCRMRILSTSMYYAVFALQFLIIILIISVIKNINPRLRIQDILKFFWFRLIPLGILGIILALRGL
jgi:NADH-quinone oxidoreductase subunit H